MAEPLRVACIGMGWWSDVLADAIKRTKKIEIVACHTRSEDKRNAFAKKYGCKPVANYDDVLADRTVEAIINTVTEGRAITEVCRKAGVVLAMGYQRRRESHFRFVKKEIEAGRFGKMVNAEANISRDRL